MSGTFPNFPGFQSVNFSINAPTMVTETISGKRQRVGMGHQFYTFSVKYPNVTQFNMGPVIGFLGAQYGPLESFQIVLPELSYSKNPFLYTAGPVSTGAAATVGQNSVSISGVPLGQTWLAAGDFFKFANHSKVYMCTADFVIGQPLVFSGSLVSDVPSGTAIVANAVPFTVILDNEIQQYSVGLGGITTMSIDMREIW
jgi:hypothetical protein